MTPLSKIGSTVLTTLLLTSCGDGPSKLTTYTPLDTPNLPGTTIYRDDRSEIVMVVETSGTCYLARPSSAQAGPPLAISCIATVPVY